MFWQHGLVSDTRVYLFAPTQTRSPQDRRSRFIEAMARCTQAPDGLRHAGFTLGFEI